MFQTRVNSGLLYLPVMSLGKTWPKAPALCAAWKLRFCLGMYYHMQPYYYHQSLRGYEARTPDRC